MEYDDDEKKMNYQRLLDVTEHQRTGGRITEDWMEENKKFILDIREFCGNIENFNMDMGDKKFRKLAEESELIMNHLVEEIQTTRTFDVDLYYRVANNFVIMLGIVSETDELCDMMSGL